MTDTGKFCEGFCLFLFQNTYSKKINDINHLQNTTMKKSIILDILE